MKILAARKYKSLRQGPLTLAEAETRRIAYAIKDPRSPSSDFDTAAAEMARLIQTPCWLVPIPASDGSTRANAILASLIARRRPGAQVAQALRRTRPVMGPGLDDPLRDHPRPSWPHSIAGGPLRLQR